MRIGASADSAVPSTRSLVKSFRARHAPTDVNVEFVFARRLGSILKLLEKIESFEANVHIT